MHFEIHYKGILIKVTADEKYQLDFPDGNWLTIEKRPDDTQTTPVENQNLSYSVAPVWVIADRSPALRSVQPEEAPLLGELILQKERESRGHEKE